jgi:hypothetical protein
MRRDEESEARSEGDPFWRWPEALLDLFESDEERSYGGLAQSLARELADAEGTAMERDATARRPMADIQAAERAAEADLQAEARQRVRDFRAALEDAYARSGGDPRREVTYDGADPGQDVMADILIRYLVRTDNAEVRTAEPAPGHYLYTLTVNWDRLRRRAEAEGISLPLGGGGPH